MTRFNLIQTGSLFVCGLFLLIPSGCSVFGEPLMGIWELVDADFIIEDTQTVDGCTVSSNFFAELTIDDKDDDDFEGELEIIVRVDSSGSCAENYDDSDKETYDIEADKEDKDEYALEADNYYDYECEIDEDGELICEDDEGDDWIFEKID